jgi:tubulin polyglutamylase TTLL4
MAWFGSAWILDTLERVRGTKKTVSRNLYYKFGESIEYPVLKNAFKRAGFLPAKAGDTFNCLWGRHLSTEEYAGLKKYQKTNHFPGTWAIGRKDNLYRNLYRMKRKFGAKHVSLRVRLSSR